MESYNVALVDDHQLVRAGLKAMVEAVPGYRVVAEADDGDRVLDLIEKHHPDVLLMDIAMERVSGLEALDRLRPNYPDLPVVILSQVSQAETVIDALKRGASGYLLKDSAELELELALNVVTKDQLFLSPKISKDVIAQFFKKPLVQEPVDEDIPLTPRQREILRLIAQGRSTKEIAYHLNVSVKTVEAHRAQIMDRLNIRDIASLVHYALRVGLVELDGVAR